MKRIKSILVIFVLMMLFSTKAWAATAWVSNLRNLFLSDGAIIYAINIRTFNAEDTNKNGIIEEDLGEKKGSFINAIDRLDELQSYGVNTIHVMPITPTGKVKALGTAGSLYSTASFNEINPQLKDKDSKMSLDNEVRKFIDECHNRNINVIVDLPSCGAYDLYLRNPDIFKKDKNSNPIIPADWTDVRLLDAGSNSQINLDVYNMYKEFVDMALDLGFDGIRADVATIKPYEFWKKLIDETRASNPQFLFLAEASDSWTKPPAEEAVFTPYNKLLDAGFDGYYGSFFNLKNWKTAQELTSHIKFNEELFKKYKSGKSVIGSFATHDEISPVLTNGIQYSRMIIWLSATLPINSYFIDGFTTGDDYIYFWANKKAPKSFTDDDYYFVHRGQMDIFNFSRKPLGKHVNFAQEFTYANRFKIASGELITNGTFATYKTSSPSIFAYSMTFDKASIIVIGNLDFKKSQEATVIIPRISPELNSIPIKISSIPSIEKGKIVTKLVPGDIQVLMFEGLQSK